MRWWTCGVTRPADKAGVDGHVDDPLGGFLTTDNMRERDRLVFGLAVRHCVPQPWNPAGGYLRDETGGCGTVLQLHRQAMAMAIEAECA